MSDFLFRRFSTIGPNGFSFHSVPIWASQHGYGFIAPDRSWLSGASLNNLELNTLKTVEMIVDFRRNPPALPPLTIMNNTVTAVESFRFWETTISQDLKWDTHIDSIVKKAQQRMYFLRPTEKVQPPTGAHGHSFYSAVIESVLCSSITVWFGSASKSDIRRLQRTVRTAERIIGMHLPSLQDLYYSKVKKRAG